MGLVQSMPLVRRMRVHERIYVVLVSIGFLSAGTDVRAEPWVERPLSLPTGHAQIQAGFGFGQYATVDGQHVGSGLNLEAALGLPFFGEVSLRSGLRFGDSGKLAGADYYGRLFDHETANLGGDAWANPEIRLRGTLADLKVFAIGLESRFVVPAASGSDFSIAPGLPMMIRIPEVLRIDTGIFLPIAFTSQTDYTVSIPVQLWIQAGEFFFGPMTGIRISRISSTTVGPDGGTSSASITRTDIPAGVGFGYTPTSMIDFKAQLYMLRINDSDWSKTVGAGFGMGLLLP
jgi:hypothetical protein